MTTTSWKDRILAEIDSHTEELIDLASALIRTPSENPPGDCTAVAGVIKGYLDDQAIPSELHDAGNGRINVVAHHAAHEGGSASTGEAHHLVLSGHHDVVPIGDASRWSFPPFAGDIVDGYLRGRGASDMKAGLAGAIFAYALLARLGVPLAGDLSLASVADEEAGGPLGADWVLENGLLEGATAAIIAEPSERTHPTIGQKGSNWFRVTIEGRPGHGSLQPLHGTSANLLAARAIIALQKLWLMTPHPDADVVPLIEHSKIYAEEREGYAPGIGAVFEHVTINVGTVMGGSATNVVADRCVIEFDTRVPIGLSRAEVLERVREILEIEEIEATVEPLGFCSEPNFTLPSEPIVSTLVTTIQDLVGPDVETSGVLQWASSDARTFRSHGIPVLQYGPAELATIHGFDERVKVDNIILAAKTYALTALDYLGTTESTSA